MGVMGWQLHQSHLEGEKQLSEKGGEFTQCNGRNSGGVWSLDF